MDLRKKPIPAPIARASEPRALVPTAVRRSLPTVAALLAAACQLACRKDADIEPDREVVSMVKYAAPAPSSATPPSVSPVAAPQPGMGGLEVAEVVPPPPAPKLRPVPSAMPPHVKGAIKHVVPPVKKPPKLGGDIAAVDPTI